MPPKIADAKARQTMLDVGIMPDPNIPFPGIGQPWQSWCLTCDYGRSVGPLWAPTLNSAKRGRGCPKCSNRARLSSVEAERIIGQYGLTPLEAFPGTVGGDWRVTCKQWHEYVTNVRKVMDDRPHKCPVCVDIEARKNMSEAGVKPDPDVPFPGRTKPWRSWCLRCGYGRSGEQRWEPRLSDVATGSSGCPGCSGRRRWTHEEATICVAEYGSTPVETYPGKVDADWRLQCAEGHEYTTTLKRIRANKSRCCRTCSRTTRLTDAEAWRRMTKHGRIVDTPYPGNVTLPWVHVIAACGHSSTQSLQEVVYYKRGCQPCVSAERGRAQRAKTDLAERKMMIEAGIMPDPDIPFPGTNEPWPSWCLKCGYGKDHGPQWTPRSGTIKSGGGCPHCAGRRRWTHEEAAAYIATYGVTPATEYPGVAKSLWRVRCAEGHEYTTSLERIREKQTSRCRDCANNMPHTAAEALKAFRELRLEPDPAVQYPGYHTPWPSTCTQCGRRCETVRLSTVLQGHGCNSCNAIRRYADPDRLAAELARWGFSLVEGHRYPGPNKLWPVRHDSCGEVFPRRMAGLRNGFRGCRNCGDQLGGLVRARPSFVYVLVNVERDSIKVGVAGHTSVYDRIADFESKGWIRYWSMNFETGYDAEAVERSVHALLRDETGQTSKRGFIPRSDMPNGHSETYSRDEIPELYVCRLVEDQAAIYTEMIQGLQDEAELGQLNLW